jgi:hypothetical protein
MKPLLQRSSARTIDAKVNLPTPKPRPTASKVLKSFLLAQVTRKGFRAPSGSIAPNVEAKMYIQNLERMYPGLSQADKRRLARVALDYAQDNTVYGKTSSKGISRLSKLFVFPQAIMDWNSQQIYDQFFLEKQIEANKGRLAPAQLQEYIAQEEHRRLFHRIKRLGHAKSTVLASIAKWNLPKTKRAMFAKLVRGINQPTLSIFRFNLGETNYAVVLNYSALSKGNIIIESLENETTFKDYGANEAMDLLKNDHDLRVGVNLLARVLKVHRGEKPNDKIPNGTKLIGD